MIYTAAQILLLLGTPVAAGFLASQVALFRALGPVLICYLVGIALANQSQLPLTPSLSQDVSGGAVVLAIPLLLLGTDFMGWVREGGKAVLSFCLACVAVSTAAALSARVFFTTVPEGWKVAGMLVGVYTGGTANLASIGRALKVSDEIYFLLNASDVVLSGLYLLFLVTAARPLLSRLLPPFPTPEDEPGEAAREGMDEGPRATPAGMAASLGIAALIGGASIGVSLALTGALSDVAIIVAITTLGIAASLHPRLRALRGSYELGNYFILVFCVAIGSLTDFSKLMTSGSTYFVFTAAVIVGAVVLHYVLAALFRIDVDTAMITSTAAVFGPPFVAMVADSLGNRRVLLSGMTTGLVGYAVGNYLGLAVAWALSP